MGEGRHKIKMEKIGLIAGSRRFPIVFAQEAKKRGVKITAVAVKGDTSWMLAYYVDKIFWLRLRDFKELFTIFKKEGINKVAMAGQINPSHLFDKKEDFGPDLSEILENIKNKKADTIFSAIADKLKDNAIELISSLVFLSEYIPKESVLTLKAPSDSQWQDINFGLDIAKRIAGLDIGQTVVVKDRAVLAVEALEGTDITISRGGLIGRGNATVVKVSKPNQDERFDVPVVGLRTISVLAKAGITCLAIEAAKTLILDKDKVIKLADKKGIAIAAVAVNPARDNGRNVLSGNYSIGKQ